MDIKKIYNTKELIKNKIEKLRLLFPEFELKISQFKNIVSMEKGETNQEFYLCYEPIVNKKVSNEMNGDIEEGRKIYNIDSEFSIIIKNMYSTMEVVKIPKNDGKSRGYALFSLEPILSTIISPDYDLEVNTFNRTITIIPIFNTEYNISTHEDDRVYNDAIINFQNFDTMSGHRKETLENFVEDTRNATNEINKTLGLGRYK